MKSDSNRMGKRKTTQTISTRKLDDCINTRHLTLSTRTIHRDKEVHVLMKIKKLIHVIDIHCLTMEFQIT